jgi:MYXO-CTERM domain-containing protein
VQANSGQTIMFAVAGGSGTGYQWSLGANESQATISHTGKYMAGALSGHDVVKVVDSLGNAATATVTVAAVSPPPLDGGAPPDLAGGSDDMGPYGTQDGGPRGGRGSGCGCGVGGASTPTPLGAVVVALGLIAWLLRRSAVFRAAKGVAPGRQT